MKGVLDAANCEWESAAAMSKGDAKFWEALEDAAEHHGANRQRSLSRHSNKPRQPVLRHALLSDHIPRMNKDRRTELFGRAPDRLERRVVQIQGIDASRMWVCVDVGSDLRPAQAQLTHAS